MDNRSAVRAGLSGVVLGILLIAAFFFGQRPSAASGVYNTDPIDVLQGGTANLLILIFGTLFSISLGIALGPIDSVLVLAGTFFVIFGFLFLSGPEYFTQTLAALAASSSDYIQGATFVATGLTLYGVMIHRSDALPNWLAYVGIVAGFMPVAGALYQVPSGHPADFAFPVFLGLFLVWVFGVSAYLLRLAGVGQRAKSGAS